MAVCWERLVSDRVSEEAWEDVVGEVNDVNHCAPHPM